VKLLDSDHQSTAIAVDPYLGMVCVGLHHASNRVRAIDAIANRALWEAPAEVQVPESTRSAVVCGGRAYLVNDTSVWAIDLYSGRMIFRAQLDSAVQCGFGAPNLWDPCHPSLPGNLVVQTVQDQYVGLERGFGTAVWTLPDAKDLGPIPVPGGVAVCAFDGEQLCTMLIDPNRGAFPVYRIGSSEVKLRAAERNVLLGAEDIDAQGGSGVAVIEMPTGRVLLQASAPFSAKRGAPVACGRYVYSTDLFRLAATPMGPSVEGELVAGYAIERLEATPAIVVALLAAMGGEPTLKLVGLDPNTLRVWYTIDADLGVGTRIRDDYQPIASLGPFVAVAGHRGERETVLTILHADTGRVGWQHIAQGAPVSVRAQGRFFLLETTSQSVLYRPDLPHPVPVASFGGGTSSALTRG
jgi:hypothetical protein